MAKYLPDDAPITPSFLSDTIADLIDNVIDKVGNWYGDEIHDLRASVEAIEDHLEAIRAAMESADAA